MWDRHKLTPSQAEEALADPYVLAYVPDPTSKSGASDRYIGMCTTLGVLVVIVVRFEGERCGANPRDAKAYWDHRQEFDDD